MPVYSKIMGGLLLSSALVLPYLASSNGWGIGTETNPEVVKSTANNCPPHQRLASGKCRYGYRSYYGGGRRMYGGGPRHGK